MTHIFIDIETIPEQPERKVRALIAKTIKAPAKMSKAETISDWHRGKGNYFGAKAAAVEAEYRNGSFDGSRGEIVSISLGGLDTPVATYFRELQGQDLERHIILTAFIQIRKLCSTSQHQSEPYFIGHNVPFDLKFLWQRAVILGVQPGFKLPFGGRHKSDFYDNMQAWAGFRQTISQDNLAKALGLPQKPDDIDGSKVWDFVKAGNAERVAEYNKYDVETVVACYKRMNFLS